MSLHVSLSRRVVRLMIHEPTCIPVTSSRAYMSVAPSSEARDT